MWGALGGFRRNPPDVVTTLGFISFTPAYVWNPRKREDDMYTLDARLRGHDIQFGLSFPRLLEACPREGGDGNPGCK